VVIVKAIALMVLGFMLFDVIIMQPVFWRHRLWVSVMTSLVVALVCVQLAVVVVTRL